MTQPTAFIQASPVIGGALVAIQRADGRSHVHLVGLSRYTRLRDTLAAHSCCRGTFLRRKFDCAMDSVRGLADVRRYLTSFYTREKHWRAA
jgi:hypothetical protein